MKLHTATENKLPPLLERIAIVNAKFENDDHAHVSFDIAVDGSVVDHMLEYLDENLRLVVQDCHLDVNKEYRDAVATALGDDRELYDEASDDARSGVLGDIAYIVNEKLVAVVRKLNASEAA